MTRAVDNLSSINPQLEDAQKQGQAEGVGRSGFESPPVVIKHFCPPRPQGLLLLRFHINIYILLESIK